MGQMVHYFRALQLMPFMEVVSRKITRKLLYQGSEVWQYTGLSLLKVKGKLNSKTNGADTAYICKHSACLHTQKCAHNVVI